MDKQINNSSRILRRGETLGQITASNSDRYIQRGMAYQSGKHYGNQCHESMEAQYGQLSELKTPRYLVRLLPSIVVRFISKSSTKLSIREKSLRAFGKGRRNLFEICQSALYFLMRPAPRGN